MNNWGSIKKLEGNYKIIQIIPSGYVIKSKRDKVLIKTNSIFNLDDLINISSTNIESIKSKKEKYNYYLKSLGINYISNNPKINKANNKTSIRSKIINYLLDGPNFYIKYTSIILLGQKNDLNQELYEKVKLLSILQLFVISGFHINLILKIILFLTKLLKINVEYGHLIALILILCYLYVLNFPISSIRATIFLFICFINKQYLKNKFSKVNILSFIMLIMFFSNPFIVFSLSFIFTFLVTFSILFVGDINNKKTRSILVVLFAYLSSVMMLIGVNGWINIFGLINSIVFSPIIIFNYVLTLFCFPFKEMLNFYFSLFERIINIFYYNSLVLEINVSQEFINIYYLILSFILININHYSTFRNINKISNSRINIRHY